MLVRLLSYTFWHNISRHSYDILGGNLMDYRIVVDAGHGGSDPGAVSGILKESDLNLEAALYMYDRFKELGVPVTITRDSDRTLTRNERLNTL